MGVKEISKEEMKKLMFNYDAVYNKLYDELKEISEEIKEWYDIDKIKDHAVYIWTKDEESGENVFDINSHEIVMFNEDHIIIEEAKPIINKIQLKLREIEEYTVLH